MDLGGTAFGGALGSVGIFLVIYLAVAVGLILLEIWVAYTVIWRAVRRGLREHDQNPTGARHPRREERYPPFTNRQGPRDW